MELKFFCPQWGSRHIDFPEFVKKVKSSGYDGIEMSLPMKKAEKKIILKTISENGLLFLAQHYETTSSDFKEHKKEYINRITNLATAQPVLVNSQTGKDFFSFEQNAELIGISYDIADRYGVKLVHETHRGKFSFAVHVTTNFIKNIPNLRLGFDVSHWCAVAESLLQDQKQNIRAAIERADHIHARVGYQEGPQITDPRLPEWKEAVDIHINWWKQVIARNKSEGKKLMTITPEFGPYPYMLNLPFTGQPLTSQWGVNVYMMNHLREILQNKGYKYGDYV